MYVNFSLCVLLQDDQSMPWSSMEDQMGDTPYLLNTRHTTAWVRENPQQENDERNLHLWDNNPTKT